MFQQCPVVLCPHLCTSEARPARTRVSGTRPCRYRGLLAGGGGVRANLYSQAHIKIELLSVTLPGMCGMFWH